MKITVVGLGKVGLPVASYLASLGHSVIGYDTNRDVVAKINSGIAVLPWEPETQLVNFVATTQAEIAFTHTDCVYVIVPTPSHGNRISAYHVRESLSEMLPFNVFPIIIGSTLHPRDADDLCDNTQYIYAPPLIRLGHVVSDLRNAKVALVGTTDVERLKLIKQMWRWDRDDISWITSTARTIAVSKLAINATLSMRVGWANEVADAAVSLGADPWVVTSAIAADPRIGSSHCRPGWAPAGPCLPRDLRAWLEFGKCHMAAEARESHQSTRERILSSILDNIESRIGGRKSTVGVLGLTYNPGALDVTESLGIEVVLAARNDGWTVMAYDPAQEYLSLPFKAQWTLSQVIAADIRVVCTPWKEFEGIPAEIEAWRYL